MNSTNITWLKLLKHVISDGRDVFPRGQQTYELRGKQTTVDMTHPVVTLKSRGLNKKFLFGEAWWILTGSNRVSDITQYMKNIAKFSDNGLTFRGAYGPQIIEQLDYVIESLSKDKDSRQAALTIWRKNPRESKDIPCTVSMQWLIRNNALHCFVNMRSSDVYLGWVYDVFNFSCVSMYLAIALKQRYPDIQLGDLVLTATSQHLYERDLSNVERCINNADKCVDFNFSLFDLQSYDHPEQFITELKWRADNA